MNKSTKKLISLEIALKNIILKLRNEGLKKATGKSESHFRKCSEQYHLHYRRQTYNL